MKFLCNAVNFKKKGLVSGDDSARIEFELCGGKEELRQVMIFFADIERVDTLELDVNKKE